MKVRVLTPALDDLRVGRRFYDRQRTGLGDYFFNSLFANIDSLAFFAGIHSKRLDFHRFLAERFPYAIYYRVLDDEAVVYRVLDCRRDPKEIQKELLKARRVV